MCGLGQVGRWLHASVALVLPAKQHSNCPCACTMGRSNQAPQSAKLPLTWQGRQLPELFQVQMTEDDQNSHWQTVDFSPQRYAPASAGGLQGRGQLKLATQQQLRACRRTPDISFAHLEQRAHKCANRALTGSRRRHCRRSSSKGSPGYQI